MVRFSRDGDQGRMLKERGYSTSRQGVIDNASIREPIREHILTKLPSTFHFPAG